MDSPCSHHILSYNCMLHHVSLLTYCRSTIFLKKTKNKNTVHGLSWCITFMLLQHRTSCLIHFCFGHSYCVAVTLYICGVWCVKKSDRWKSGIPFLHSWQPTGISYGELTEWGQWEGWGVCVCVVIYRVSSWSDTGLTKIDNKAKKHLVELKVNFQEWDFGIMQ